MNRNTINGLLSQARNSVSTVARKVGQAAAVTGATIGTAMAAPAGYDTAPVVAAIVANTGKALLVIGAFILAVWTLRAMGLLKRG